MKMDSQSILFKLNVQVIQNYIYQKWKNEKKIFNSNVITLSGMITRKYFTLRSVFFFMLKIIQY